MATAELITNQPNINFFSQQHERLSISAQKLAKHIKNNAAAYISTAIAIAAIAYHFQHECQVDTDSDLNSDLQDFCSRLALLPQENNANSALDAIENLQFAYEDSKFDFSSGWLTADSKVSPAQLMIQSNCAKQIQDLSAELEDPKIPLKKLTDSLIAAAGSNNELWLKLAKMVQENAPYKALPTVDQIQYWRSVYKQTHAVTMYNPSGADTSHGFYQTPYDAANPLAEIIAKRSFFMKTAHPFIAGKYVKLMLAALKDINEIKDVDEDSTSKKTQLYSALEEISKSTVPFQDILRTTINKQDISQELRIFQLTKLNLLET